MATFALLVLLAGLLPLTTCTEVVTDFVDCGPVDSDCECDPAATVCSFQFYVEHIFTFVKYNSSILYADGQGERFYIDDHGNFVSYLKSGKCMDGDFVKRGGSDLYCNEMDVCIEKNQRCTELLSVDGKTYKSVIAVNKQFPGPTIIVTEGQIISVDVHNNLSTEAISVHWHGQHQIMTNIMDGVGLVTQCPILPGNSFRYIFKSGPSGTFWYHAHEGSQRSNGLFGGLIVKEKKPVTGYPFDFEDDPISHTIIINDLYPYEHEDFFRAQEFDIGQFPDAQPYSFPSDINAVNRYFPTFAPDFSEVGINQFWSALINGKGRHSDVSYNRSRLSVFQVDGGKTYRFRLINAASSYAFRFSINDHKLKVMATDGYIVQPVEVDYIVINSGERYDFLLETNQETNNYGIKAETLEVMRDFTLPAPYDFFDHKTEAILHYKTSTTPKSNDYEQILLPQRNCSQETPCVMLNCLFEKFHPSYNIECIGIDTLRLFQATPVDQMPDSEPDITYFTNLGGFAGPMKPLNSINDKHFVVPASPLTTYYDDNIDSFCDVNSVCNKTSGCFCTTVMDIGHNVTVRLVLSTIGEERIVGHPMHIHGHSVHVLKIGYGKYSNITGGLVSSSRDLTCSEDGNDADTLDNMRCPNPRFRIPNQNFDLSSFTVRKDTFIVPSGGYTVVQFRSDNPGYWLLHCHRQLHRRQGMVLIIQEAVDQIHPPPDEMGTCRSFTWDVQDFMTFLNNRGGEKLTVPNLVIIFTLIILGELIG